MLFILCSTCADSSHADALSKLTEELENARTISSQDGEAKVRLET